MRFGQTYGRRRFTEFFNGSSSSVTMNQSTDELAIQATEPEKLRWFQRTIAALTGIDKGATTSLSANESFLDSNSTRERVTGLCWAVFSCVLATVVALALRNLLAPANLVMLYLLAVVLVTVRFGRKPGVLASFLAVLTFDVFLVPPYYSLTVVHSEYLFTFAIMLVVSLLISHLTANLRQQALIAHYRERRARALFELSRDLSAALSYAEISEIGMRHLATMLQAKVVVFAPDSEGNLHPLTGDQIALPVTAEVVRRTIQRVFDGRPSTELESRLFSFGGTFYLPLRAPMRTRGVLVVVPETPWPMLAKEQERLMQTCASLIALALERVHYADVAQAATVSIESERLRNSLLSAISHDIRTPLTAIVGLSSALAGDRPLPSATKQELSEAIQENAIRMSNLVGNLLDMAKLHAGTVKLNLQWQMLEEVVGSSLMMLSRALEKRRIEVALPSTLPLLEFDAVLMERVLCNLLDNAAKYTADNGSIWITADAVDNEVHIVVEDNGCGIPKGMEETIFTKFARGEPESSQSGVGLGLSICRTIIEAHGGRIWAENRDDGGARLVFTLLLGTPPADDDHEDISPLQTDSSQ